MIFSVKNVINKDINIAIVGKYVKLEDSYISVIEAVKHGGFTNNTKVNIEIVNCENINNENAKDVLGKYNGIIVPGGFGNRGIDGKIATIKYARENKIPFLGICLGMQMAVVEFARDVLGYTNANSEEFDNITKTKVIHIMEEQTKIDKKGGTMRLGAYPCILKKDSLAYEIYGQDQIEERHRHRYEYNNEYKGKLEAKGLICSGTSPDGKLVEIVEIKNHPYFIATQFHPEFKSRPDKPHPLFTKLIKATLLN